MFNLTADQIVACLIVLAYFGGALMGGSIVYYIQCRSEQAEPTYRKPKMELDADLDAIDQALSVGNS